MARTIKTYLTTERATHGDFWIRNENRASHAEHAHRHEFFQIQVNLEGTTRHYIGAAERRLEPGSLAFVLPYRVHLGGRPANSRFYVINFQQNFLFPDLNVDPLELENVPIAQAPLLAPFLFQDTLDFVLRDADLELVRNACGKMMAEHARRSLFSRDIIRANLALLIGTVCERFEKPLSLADGHAQQRHHTQTLARVMRYIRENLSGDITLAKAARAANLSPNYLTNLLKQETGKTFTSLVTSRRMEKARELLTHTTLRVSEIAGAAGFEDEAYFNRRFRQYFHTSPAAYRDRETPAAVR